MQHKIAVVGSINTDMVVGTQHIPAPGQTLMGHSFIITGGGKGANQAVAAARLGGHVSFIGRVGNDTFGETSVKLLSAENINTDCIGVDEKEPSGVALIVVDSKGENIIVVAPGSNAALQPQHVLQAALQIEDSSIVLFQLEIPLTTVEAGMKLVKQLGKTVLLNPAPAAALSVEMLGYVDILVPNQSETFSLTGIEVNNETDAAAACELLHQKGIKTIIITMGAAGAYISSAHYKGMIKGFTADKVVDTVAAGDTFCGALAVELAAGKMIDEAVRFANAAACLSVTKKGAQASIPDRKEVIEFLNKKKLNQEQGM